jgi:hypothetical protein
MHLNAVLIDPRDNVVTALRAIEEGELVTWPGGHVRATAAISVGHKLAITAIAEGATVIKYGHSIGVASVAIEAGAHVHSHCMKGKE